MKTRALSAAALLSLAVAACRGDEPAAVRVYRDELAIPHVFGDTDADVFRGLGYTQARDFPVATLSNLWSATGRFAEVAGRPVLARDERMRQWGFDRRARELAEDPEALDETVRGFLRAYVEGVNAGRRWWLADPARLDALAGTRGELAFDPVPPWLQPNVVQDDPRALLGRLFELEVGLEHVLALGLTLTAGPRFGGAGQSLRTNLWAVRGGEEDPGTRFMADLHQPLQAYGYRSYFVQLAGPGYDVVGYTSPGFPCIATGTNRALAFGSMTLPRKPVELDRAGLPFRIEGDSPRSASTWSARLEQGPPARLVRGEETVELVTAAVKLRYWDPQAGALREDPRGALSLRWVPDGPLLLPVVEPGPEQPLDLAARPVVRFEGLSFLTQRSIWETWIQLALSTRVGAGEGGVDSVLRREPLAAGGGNMLLLADVEGGLEFLWGARVPVQAPEALARTSGVLDGSDPAHRWLGFHGLDALPRGVLEAPRGERPVAWIECNGSPEFLGPGLEEWSWDGPATIWSRQPWKTRRQDRARTLFDRAAADGRLERAELQAMALDVQDGWSRAHWPRIEGLASSEGVLSERARAFSAWLAQHRDEGPDGAPGADPFLAHPLSRVMPWMVLVRDRYEDALVDGPAPADALALAFDPLLDALPLAAFLTEDRHAANRRALVAALEWTAELHERTLAGREGGLVNVPLLTGLVERRGDAPALFPDPWSAPAYRAADSGPRWGMVNLYALTPHRTPFDPPPANGRLVDAWLATFLAPEEFESPLPYYRSMPSVVFPVGGTYGSLFQVHRTTARSSVKALLPREGGFLQLRPADFGSQALFLAELVPGERPRVSVLPALGATELLIGLDEGGPGSLALYAPTARFAAGQWSDLTTDEESLRARPGVRSSVLGE